MPATAAPEELHASVVLDVAPFERMELRDPVNWVDIVAEPGERELVVVEGPPSMLARLRADVEDGTLRITLGGSVADHVRDAFTTSLTRRRLTYRVQARRLLEVRVGGLVRIAVHAFGENAPVVTRLGPHPPAPPFAPR